MSDRDLILYPSEDGGIHIHVQLEDETVWLTQAVLGERFGCTTANVIQHLANIYESEDLSLAATSKDFLVVRQEGTRQVSRTIKHNNLDAIIAVGYRVNSRRATPFRIWATMNDWIAKLDAILTLNGRERLTHAGSISAELAREISAAPLGQLSDRLRQQEIEAGLDERERDLEAVAGQKTTSRKGGRP